MIQHARGGEAQAASTASPDGTDTAAWFRGFWMGGFEGADHVNALGDRLDMAGASGHLDRLEEDHRRAAAAGIRCVRESIGWRLAESGDGAIDLERALRIAHSARRHGLQVLWTVMHYGVPDGLSLRDDRMIDRLARFCGEVARSLAPLHSQEPPLYTPVNEIGFLAWAASQPGHLAPPSGPEPVVAGGEAQAADDSRISGYTIKRRLARAALAAMAAMQAADPRSRFLHVEPLVHVEPPDDRPDLADFAAEVRSWQWQAWDLLAGRLEPDLGGDPRWLDVLGVNHYHSSQWELVTERRLDWAARDPRRRPMSCLLGEAWTRYRRPLILAETSHVGRGRAQWLHEMAGELRRARRQGVPVQGLCIYPLVDRPDWNAPDRWHKSGLWHVAVPPGPVPRSAPSASERPLARHGEPDGMAMLRDWRDAFGGPTSAGPVAAPPQAALVVFTDEAWHGLPGRTRGLLQALARHDTRRRVVVVQTPRHEARRTGLDVAACGPNLDLLVPFGPDACADTGPVGALPTPPAVEPWAPLVARWLDGEGLTVGVRWVTCPSLWPLASAMGGGPVVYDCARDLGPGGPSGAAGAVHLALEGSLVCSAARVVCASAELAARHTAAAPGRIEVLSNGVDRVRFRSSPHPRADWAYEEFAALPGPSGPAVLRIASTGRVDAEFDLALLAGLAEARPHWHWLLAGPVHPTLADRLPRAPNLHWLGDLPHAVIPLLLASAGLYACPRVGRPGDRGAIGLGVLEALAMGLPVVAPAARALRSWTGAGVHAASDPAGFLAACDAALGASAADRASWQRRARRRLHGLHWPALATQLDALLQALQPAGAGRSVNAA